MLLRCSAYFLDANFLIATHVRTHSDHRAAKHLLAQLMVHKQQGAVDLWISPLVIDEALWIVLQVLYDRDHGRGGWAALQQRTRSADAAERQAAKSDRAAAIGRYVNDLRGFRDFILARQYFTVADVGSAEAASSVDMMDTHRLPPRDAFHCATMHLRGIRGIVSNDRDFEGLSHLDQRLPFRA